MLETKKKILIIEDDPISRELTKETLLNSDFVVVEASNGKEGIDVALTEYPDLIICDALMEGMDGFKVLGMIRSNPEWADIPVIMLSSLSSAEVIDRAMDAGADSFMPKGTTTPAKLAEHVMFILEKRK